jgi:hypothetical protein
MPTPRQRLVRYLAVDPAASLRPWITRISNPRFAASHRDRWPGVFLWLLWTGAAVQLIIQSPWIWYVIGGLNLLLAVPAFINSVLWIIRRRLLRSSPRVMPVTMLGAEEPESARAIPATPSPVQSPSHRKGLSFGNAPSLIRRTLADANGRLASRRTKTKCHGQTRVCHECAMTLMSVSRSDCVGVTVRVGQFGPPREATEQGLWWSRPLLGPAWRCY